MSDALLRCTGLDIGIGECMLVAQLDLALASGSVTAVLGRNGAGKSLTMHTLAGLRPASAAGSIEIAGRPLAQHSRRALAQQLAFVAQDGDEPFPVTVLDSAVSGRHPHIGFWQWESASDYALAHAALSEVDLAEFADRATDTLSGGERRRLAIATVLTQAPNIYLLDEPTNHLDPQHQLQILKLMRSRADAGCAVLMSLHDPGLAARFADFALLLFGDGRWLHGPTKTILNEHTMADLYRVKARLLVDVLQPNFVFG